MATWRSLAVCLGTCVLIGCTPGVVDTPRVVYSDDGLSELNAPGAWRTRPILGKRATLRVGDDTSASYLVVNTYPAEDTKAEPLSRFAERLSSALMKRLRGGRLSAPRPLTIHGRPAVEYEVAGAAGNLDWVYLSTVVDGPKARHHVVAWTPADRYGASQAMLRDMAASLRESAERRPAKPRIDLTFDWPERLTSTANIRMKTTKRGEVHEVTARAVSTVRALGDDELLISAKVTDRKFAPGTKDKGKADYLERVLQEAMVEIPDYVVDRDGEFIRVENIGPYVKRIEDALVQNLPDGPKEARAKARELVKSILSEETLSAAMQDEWNHIVGNWADGSYVPGEVYEHPTTYQSPALGSQAFPMMVTQQLAGREPCRKGAAAHSCVRLLQTSRVSDAGFTRATSAFVRKTLGTTEVTVDKAEVVKTVEVIADPRTLLPYRSVMKETKSFVVSAQGSAPRASEEVKETVVTYTY